MNIVDENVLINGDDIKTVLTIACTQSVMSAPPPGLNGRMNGRLNGSHGSLNGSRSSLNRMPSGSPSLYGIRPEDEALRRLKEFENRVKGVRALSNISLLIIKVACARVYRGQHIEPTGIMLLCALVSLYAYVRIGA